MSDVAAHCLPVDGEASPFDVVLSYAGNCFLLSVRKFVYDVAFNGNVSYIHTHTLICMDLGKRSGARRGAYKVFSCAHCEEEIFKRYWSIFERKRKIQNGTEGTI